MTSLEQVGRARAEYMQHRVEHSASRATYHHDMLMLELAHNLAIVEHCRTFNEDIKAGMTFVSHELEESKRILSKNDHNYQIIIPDTIWATLTSADDVVWVAEFRDEDEAGNHFDQPCRSLSRCVRFALDYGLSTQEDQGWQETIDDNCQDYPMSEVTLQCARMGLEMYKANKVDAFSAAFLRLVGSNCGIWGFIRKPLLG